VSNVCYAVGRYLAQVRTFKFVPNCEVLPFHICVSKDAGPIYAVDVNKFVSKVVFVKCNHLPVNIVCIPPNRYEVLK